MRPIHLVYQCGDFLPWPSARKLNSLARLAVRWVQHGAYSAECCPPTGIASSKIEPSESDLTSRNLPPWFSTTVKQIASPIPIPPDFVVKNGSNIRSRSWTGIPGPESWTESISVKATPDDICSSSRIDVLPYSVFARLGT